MMYKSNVQTKSLYWGEASSIAQSESARIESQASFLEETIGDVTERGGLLEKGPGLITSDADPKEDKDVVLLKKNIIQNLQK